MHEFSACLFYRRSAYLCAGSNDFCASISEGGGAPSQTLPFVRLVAFTSRVFVFCFAFCLFFMCFHLFI